MEFKKCHLSIFIEFTLFGERKYLISFSILLVGMFDVVFGVAT